MYLIFKIIKDTNPNNPKKIFENYIKGMVSEIDKGYKSKLKDVFLNLELNKVQTLEESLKNQEIYLIEDKTIFNKDFSDFVRKIINEIKKLYF